MRLQMTMILKEIQIHCDGVNNVRLGVLRGMLGFWI